MKRSLFALVAIVALMAAPRCVSRRFTRWVNVTVTENSSNTNVEVHLPLNLVLTVLRNVDVENFHTGTSISSSTTIWTSISPRSWRR